jgi:hypothetical protein
VYLELSDRMLLGLSQARAVYWSVVITNFWYFFQVLIIIFVQIVYQEVRVQIIYHIYTNPQTNSLPRTVLGQCDNCLWHLKIFKICYWRFVSSISQLTANRRSAVVLKVKKTGSTLDLFRCRFIWCDRQADRRNISVIWIAEC